MTTGQEGGNNNVLNAFLAGLATFLMGIGAWILNKLNKTPRPRDLTNVEYLRIRRELEVQFRQDMKPLYEALDALTKSLMSESTSLRGDMQELRGEMGQLSQRVSRQGGVLRGLEDRFNAD